MSVMAFQITVVSIVYSTVSSGADQRKHQSSAFLAFVWGIHRWSVNSSHKRPVTRKMFPFDDVIMWSINKMAVILPSIFSMYLLNENHRILIQIQPKFVLKGTLKNKPWLVQGMAWCRTSAKPLPEPAMTQSTVTNVCMWPQVTMCWGPN